jgi:hypothetical protein
MTTPVLSPLGLDPVTSDPASPGAGAAWFRSDLNQIRYYDGTAVRIFGQASMDYWRMCR